MRAASGWVAGLVLVAGVVGVSFAGSGLHQLGDLGGASRSFGYNLARLPGDRDQTLTLIAATSYAERLLWHHQPDPTQDWVQAVDDPSHARFLEWKGVRRTGFDPGGLAVFGLRDEEETSAVRTAIMGSSYADDRAEIALPGPLVRSLGGGNSRVLETRFGEISRTLLTSHPDRDAETASAVGVLRVRAVSTARRTGRWSWALAWSVENNTGTSYSFVWPSVLTESGEEWQGTLEAGETALLERTVSGRPRVLAGPVSLTRTGEVHPDYRGPAAHYAPAD